MSTGRRSPRSWEETPIKYQPPPPPPHPTPETTLHEAARPPPAGAERGGRSRCGTDRRRDGDGDRAGELHLPGGHRPGVRVRDVGVAGPEGDPAPRGAAVSPARPGGRLPRGAPG